MDKKTRKEILARITAGVKQFKLDDDSMPKTWADRVDIQVPVIPTPSARLNAALGVGGIPLGRITEIYGNESAGKTTLMLQIIAQAQAMGMACGYIDMEHALDASYAQALGVNMDELFISQPVDGNQALQLFRIMVDSGIKLVVLDSIPALVAREEYQKEITDNHVGLQARMMGQTVRQLASVLSRAGAAGVFINQLREKIGVMYGNPETTPGGRAIKFFASVRIDMRALSKKDDNGRLSKIKVVKNKLAPPFRECEVDILYGKGFDRLKDTVLYAKELGVITGRSWMTLPRLDCPGMELVDADTDLKFQGTDSVVTFVDQTEGYLDALMAKCQRASKGETDERRDEESGDDSGVDARDAELVEQP